eukprot:TRINITY_DN31937_c0_g1_i15.p1 TRINITY_DN31937_c0_g1~~TRINITY_DN31937_c0_g1_i15.p1  ORF type:complete len:219 (+),score=11.73 TRINITY_DN31937_c0_g1_i15:1342-1998(+)
MSSIEGDIWIQWLVYISSDFAGVSRGSQQDDPAHFIPANWVGIYSMLCPLRKFWSAVTSSSFPSGFLVNCSHRSELKSPSRCSHKAARSLRVPLLQPIMSSIEGDIWIQWLVYISSDFAGVAEAGLSRHDGKALESKKTVSALDDLIDIPLPLLILSGVCLELQACNTCLSLGSSSLKHLLSTPRSAMATTCSVGCDMLIAETKVRLVLPAARITIEK